MKPARCRSPVPAPKVIQSVLSFLGGFECKNYMFSCGMSCCEVCARRYLGHICEDWWMRFLFYWCLSSKESLCCSVDNISFVFEFFIQHSAEIPSSGCGKREEEWGGGNVSVGWSDGAIILQPGEGAQPAMEKTRNCATSYLSSLAKIIILIYKWDSEESSYDFSDFI